jgi:hypothetical protein
VAPPSAPIPAPFSLVDNGVEQPELAAITSIANKMISPFLPFIIDPFLLDPIPDSFVDLRIAPARSNNDLVKNDARRIPYTPDDKTTAN